MELMKFLTATVLIIFLASCGYDFSKEDVSRDLGFGSTVPHSLKILNTEDRTMRDVSYWLHGTMNPSDRETLLKLYRSSDGYSTLSYPKWTSEKSLGSMECYEFLDDEDKFTKIPTKYRYLWVSEEGDFVFYYAETQ